MTTLRELALLNVAHALDDAGADRTGEPIPANAVLVGWQCGFEPLFVAVWSYLPNVTLDQDDAVSIASDYLDERGWFAHPSESSAAHLPVEPDWIIGGRDDQRS